jgi:uncharacterized membrane protein YczE
MNEKFIRNMPLRVILYIFGVVVTGLGINVLLRLKLGAGAWDTVSSDFRILANILLNTGYVA